MRKSILAEIDAVVNGSYPGHGFLGTLGITDADMVGVHALATKPFVADLRVGVRTLSSVHRDPIWVGGYPQDIAMV